MSNAGFEKMYPALLEDCLQEVGDLLGETLKLDSQAFDQGSLGEVLLPRKKKTGCRLSSQGRGSRSGASFHGS